MPHSRRTVSIRSMKRKQSANNPVFNQAGIKSGKPKINMGSPNMINVPTKDVTTFAEKVMRTDFQKPVFDFNNFFESHQKINASSKTITGKMGKVKKEKGSRTFADTRGIRSKDRMIVVNQSFLFISAFLHFHFIKFIGHGAL